MAMRWHEILESIDASDSDLFGHRQLNRFSMFGLSGVDFSTVEFSDIDRSEYPDLTGYVTYAEFKPGITPAGHESLDDEELEHLNDELYRTGEMYDLLHSKLFESESESDSDLFGEHVGIEKAWRGVAKYMSWFPKVYTVLRQSGKIYGELKHRTGTSDPEFSEIVAVATPLELLALSAELKKIAEITEWEFQRQRRVNEGDK